MTLPPAGLQAAVADGQSAAYSVEGFRRDIEGLRGLAILLVVGYHAGLPWLRGGYVGVDVFFVISGYLITGLLLAEVASTGRVDLWEFYARRVRRLVPASAALLGAIVALTWILFGPSEFAGVAGSARAAAIYLSNVLFALNAMEYLRASRNPDLFLHTWSLSVEEQFYLLWPLLIWAALCVGRFGRRSLLFLLVATGLASWIGCVVVTDRVQPWAFFMMPARWWEFCLGGAGRLAMSQGHSRRAASLPWVASGSLLLILASAYLLDDTAAFPGAIAAVPAIATLGVLLGGSAPARQFLEFDTLRSLGRLSYALYLWHWPLLAFAASWSGNLSNQARLSVLLVSLALAWLSTTAIEVPIRRSRWLARHPRVCVIGAGSLGVLLFMCFTIARREARAAAAQPPFSALALSARDLPRLYEDGCVVPPLSVDPPSKCSYGSPNASVRIVLFGDSHAAQWFPAVDRLAQEYDWRVTVLAKASCPPASVSVVSETLKRDFSECDRWRQVAIDRINALNPELVLMSGSSGYVPIGGASPTSTVSDSAWMEGYLRTATQIERAPHVAVIRDIPHLEFEPATCLARRVKLGRWSPACEIAAGGNGTPIHRIGAVRRDAIPPVLWEINLNDAICSGTCPVQRADTVIYRDSHHLTATFAASLAPVLEARLRAIGATVAP